MSGHLPPVDLEVGILGPFEVVLGGDRLDLGSPRQRVVLAVLALEANRLVPVGRLVDAVYGADPPSTSRVQVQICISALRRLFAAHGCHDAIASRPHGYVLRVSDDRIDLWRYADLLAQARRFREERRFDEAVGCYRAALAQWRGAALDGVDSAVVQAAAARLDEQRVSVMEDCVELELGLGRHGDLVAELTALADKHPLRERLQGQLMLALYRSGRQADALAVYRRARRILVDELGIEPNADLQQLEHDILTGDGRLSLPAPSEVGAAGPAQPIAAPVPRLLPTDIADFTGRDDEIDAVVRHLTGPTGDKARLAVPLVVVSGMAGVGKTTLAVHVSHRLSGRYPDGQLFVDLRGQTIRPAPSTRVLERFLRVLGVRGAALPRTLEERAEMYRHLLSGRRVLVILDNAGDEGQVLPLLPGTPPAAALITSRSRLAGLPGAAHVEVDLLDPPHSLELLSRVAGRDRMRAEPAGAAELAELCGHLPLALRVAGARLATRPQWTVGQLVERLGNEARRLYELNHGVLDIRASISLTYDSLGQDAQRLFRRLALLDFPNFSGWTAAALLDRNHADAQDLLDDLADAHLVETTGAGRGPHSQYRFHDLIRVFARDRLTAEEPPPDRDAALTRALGALLFLAEHAHRGAYGSDEEYLHSNAPRWPVPDQLADELMPAPLAWLERERSAIHAGVRQAANAGFVDLCWDLAQTGVTLYESGAYLDDWRETHEIALDAVRRAGDAHGQAVMSYSTGSLHVVERRFDEAMRHLETAVGLFRSAGNDGGEAQVICHIAFVDRVQGRLDDAAARYGHALEIFRRAGELVESAYVLQSLAEIKLERGDANGAQRMLSEALDLSRRGGSRRVEAQVLHRLGETYLRLDAPSVALDAFTGALAAVKDANDPIGKTFVLSGLGTAYLRMGRMDESGAALGEALRLAIGAGDPLTEARTLLALGELDLARGEPRQATVRLNRALELSRSIDARLHESKVLGLLARANQTVTAPGGASDTHGADNELKASR